MIYVMVEDGVAVQYPMTGTDLRRKKPNTSFPNCELPEATMADFGCYPVDPAPPSFDANTQRAVELIPANIGGRWVQAWSIVDLTQDEISQRNSNQWAAVRDQRNVLLAACDWTQLPDAPVDNLSWAVYRQALRDITLQVDPFALAWPVAP